MVYCDTVLLGSELSMNLAIPHPIVKLEQVSFQHELGEDHLEECVLPGIFCHLYDQILMVAASAIVIRISILFKRDLILITQMVKEVHQYALFVQLSTKLSTFAPPMKAEDFLASACASKT